MGCQLVAGAVPIPSRSGGGRRGRGGAAAHTRSLGRHGVRKCPPRVPPAQPPPPPTSRGQPRTAAAGRQWAAAPVSCARQCCSACVRLPITRHVQLWVAGTGGSCWQLGGSGSVRLRCAGGSTRNWRPWRLARPPGSRLQLGDGPTVRAGEGKCRLQPDRRPPRGWRQPQASGLMQYGVVACARAGTRLLRMVAGEGKRK